ncbi:hypothetical protein F5884DRAFT_855513 [Xylogone sp. PMI_703]|nr:hypothetical protein F5884DRAFT_855513 [Xylogone sp. PMI_703]
MSSEKAADYELHYNQFSICSTQTRLTLAMQKLSKTPEQAIPVKQTHVDIYKAEQLSENYLINVNPKGQVPAMTSLHFTNPLTDSYDITEFIGDKCTGLCPPPHRETILRLLKELHAIQFLALSFKPHENRAEGITKEIQARLALKDISEQYRKALEWKAAYHERTLVHALEPEQVAKTRAQTLKFFSNIIDIRESLGKGSSWIFGDEIGPTLLDAHTIPLIARLYDADNEELMDERIKAYGRPIMNSDVYNEVMQGRPTLHHLWKH